MVAGDVEFMGLWVLGFRVFRVQGSGFRPHTDRDDRESDMEYICGTNWCGIPNLSSAGPLVQP